MKGFVVLAIVLLVPTLAYFQKQHFESRLQPKLKASVLEVLTQEGVEAPAVRMEYFDAVISGRVESEAQREAVAVSVDALPGVRMGAKGNQLQTYGWIRISRTGGKFGAEGSLPESFVLQLPDPLVVEDGWDAGLERRKTVVAPVGAEGWSPFLKYYFRDPGDRSVEVRQSALVMEGDATVGLRGDWRAKASDVVDRSQVGEGFTLHPSLYHFPGYQPSSMADTERYERLRAALAETVIKLHARPPEDEEVFLPEAQRAKVVEAAKVILNAGEKVRYTVGGHPGSDGNVTASGQLARRRAEAVVKHLVEQGVPTVQLEAVSFGVTPGDERDNQVEILVK